MSQWDRCCDNSTDFGWWRGSASPVVGPDRLALTLTLALALTLSLSLSLALTLTLALALALTLASILTLTRSLTSRSTALRLHHFVTRSASECRRKKGDQPSAASWPLGGDLITCLPCAKGACCSCSRRRRRSPWPSYQRLLRWPKAQGPIKPLYQVPALR